MIGFRKINTVLIAAVSLFVCGAAHAGGFYIQEQSVSGLGEVFAGGAAGMPDASTLYYNPAGMTDLSAGEASLGTHVIIPASHFRDNGSTASSLPGTAGASVALSGGNVGNPYEPTPVPNAYLVFPVTQDKRLWAGIGISAPFGLGNEYEEGFVGRYDSTQSELKTINVSPSLAYAIRDWISVGLGLDVQYAEAKLENAIPSPVTAGGPRPGTDGMTDLSGDDTSLAFNGGLIIKPGEGTKLGLHYRQGASHTLEGRVITNIPSDIPVVGGSVTRTSGQAELDLPDMVSAGFSQKIGDKLTVLGQVIWFEWSGFDDIPVLLGTGQFTSQEQNYKDTVAVALGARYQLTPRLQLRTGVQFDPTPTQDGFRNTRTPDGDRIWVGAGLSYDIDPSWTLDLSGAYIDVAEERIDLSHTVPVGGASTTYNLRGATEGDVGIVSAGLRYKLGVPKKPSVRN